MPEKLGDAVVFVDDVITRPQVEERGQP